MGKALFGEGTVPARRRWPVALLAVVLVAVCADGARAQPFGAWLTSSPGFPTSSGFVQVPANAALTPSAALTVEAWVAISNSTTAEDCRSIVGTGYQHNWWLGQCTIGGQPTLRSYLKGGLSVQNGGIIPRGVWTHVAVVFTGTQRRHYINGELAATFAETGPLPGGGSDLQIGSDVNWLHSPNGAIDEVRLWNVARTTAQIRSAINVRIHAPQAGLVAVWPLDGNGNDVVGGHNGTLMGTGVGFLTSPVALDCGTTTTSALCLNSRFSITAQYRTNPTPGTPTDGNAHVVVAGPNSGIFWFFGSDNWEILVKSINACTLNDRYWVFSAATTNVFYRLEVTDVHGAQKIYFNYPGPPAPAVTDTDAFATCP